jgi:hypothetical protein
MGGSVEESMRLAVVARQRGGALALSMTMLVLGFGCDSTPPGGPNSFTEVYTQIIQPKCSNDFCHYQNISIRYSALDMSSQVSAYWNLVDQLCAGAACSGNGYRRVVPGDPDHSMLYEKVSQKNPPCGVQMPADIAALQEGTPQFSGTELSKDQQSLIYNWIRAGAQDN